MLSVQNYKCRSVPESILRTPSQLRLLLLHADQRLDNAVNDRGVQLPGAVRLVLVGAGGGDLAQLVLAGELAAQLAQVCDDALDSRDQDFLGRLGAVRLNAEEDLWHVGMRDYT